MALLLGALSACGFQPLYGKRTDSGAGAATPISQVNIVRIPDREGQFLRNLLIDRFQPTGASRYQLTTDLSVREEELGVAEDSTTTRSRVIVNALFTLTYGQKVHQFTARSASSFSTVQSDYGTLVARETATEGALRDIADEAKVRLSAFLRQLESG